MRIRITGSPDHTTRRMVCRAVRWYCKKLKFHSTLYQNLRLHIVFGEPGCKADVEWLDRATKARSFKMTIRPTMSEDNVLASVAHEIVHIKQYASGILTDVGDKVRWDGEILDFQDDIESDLYWFSPWELEARAMERGLMMMFKASLKK